MGVEISFLRLIHMDLSANRITSLPVELRFMNSVVNLSLGENPLSCPPANLCSRGKVHVFKYLEIQAIKEDRKRGVLTDSEYRRSYRHKASAGQLNDFRFANGFGADARRKRHTADSGYGSEQPLDRRWSQDFSQDAVDMNTEDARRIILRAANVGNRSPHKGIKVKSANDQIPHIINIAGSRVSASAATSASTSPPVMNIAMTPINQQQIQENITVPLPPLTSNGSSGSSSGHSSMSGYTAVPPIPSSSFDMEIEGTSNPHLRLLPSSSPSSQSSATSSPSAKVSQPQQEMYFPSTFSHKPLKDTRTQSKQEHSPSNTQTKYIQNGHDKDNKFVDMPANETDSERLLLIKSTDDQLANDHLQHTGAEAINNNRNNERGNSDIIDELEKDERRIVASKLLERQGIPGPNNTTAKFTQNHKFPSTTNTSILPIPQASNHSSRHAQPLLPPSQSNNSHPTHGSAKHNSNPKSGQTTPTNISPNSLLPIPVSSINTAPSSHQKTHVYSHRQIKEPPKRSKNNSVSVPTLRSPSGSIPIKIEHQSSGIRDQQNKKPSTVLEDSFKHYDQPSDIGQSNFVTHAMQITAKNAISNNKGIHSSSSSSSSTYSVASSSTNPSTVRIQTSPSSTSTSSSSLTGGSIEAGNMAAPNSSIKKTSSYDVKAFQKEAVLSYVKAKQHSPAHSVASLQPHEISDSKNGIAGHRSLRPECLALLHPEVHSN